MNKKMKIKRLFLALYLVAAVAVMAGCHSKQPEASEKAGIILKKFSPRTADGIEFT